MRWRGVVIDKIIPSLFSVDIFIFTSTESEHSDSPWCEPITPLFSEIVRLVVTMIKPTTSYFLFLITFRHNRICGLAVAFKNIFLGVFPRSKINPEIGESCAKPAEMPIM
jgi:hypothetical protein